MNKSVKIIIVNDENKLMLHLRDNKEGIPYPDYWDFIGGAIEEGESELEAIKREIDEEIGINVEKIRLVGYIDFVNDVKTYYCRVSMFAGKTKKQIGEIKLTEGQKIDYFDFSDVSGLKMTELNKRFILENKKEILSEC